MAMAREAAGLKADEKVTVVEIGKARPSAAALLGEWDHPSCWDLGFLLYSGW